MTRNGWACNSSNASFDVFLILVPHVRHGRFVLSFLSNFPIGCASLNLVCIAIALLWSHPPRFSVSLTIFVFITAIITGQWSSAVTFNFAFPLHWFVITISLSLSLSFCRTKRLANVLEKQFISALETILTCFKSCITCMAGAWQVFVCVCVYYLYCTCTFRPIFFITISWSCPCD